MTKPFTRGTWHGMTTYQCTLCQFDCMDEEQHWRTIRITSLNQRQS